MIDWGLQENTMRNVQSIGGAIGSSRIAIIAPSRTINYLRLSTLLDGTMTLPISSSLGVSASEI